MNIFCTKDVTKSHWEIVSVVYCLPGLFMRDLANNITNVTLTILTVGVPKPAISLSSAFKLNVRDRTKL